MSIRSEQAKKRFIFAAVCLAIVGFTSDIIRGVAAAHGVPAQWTGLPLSLLYLLFGIYALVALVRYWNLRKEP